jgi:hypothetical protein
MEAARCCSARSVPQRLAVVLPECRKAALGGFHLRMIASFLLDQKVFHATGLLHRGKDFFPIARTVIPQRPYERCSMDFADDQLAAGRSFRVITVVDQVTLRMPVALCRPNNRT